MVRRIVAFVVALLVMIVAGSASHSLFVQNAWSDSVGMAEGAPGALQTGERISWIAHDLIGLEPLYGALTGVALLIAFLAAGLMARYTGLRPIVFAVAGAVAIFVLFTVMRMQLGTVAVCTGSARRWRSVLSPVCSSRFSPARARNNNSKREHADPSPRNAV